MSSPIYSHGTCAICKERYDFLMALHSDKGGPACCLYAAANGTQSMASDAGLAASSSGR